MLLFRTVQSDVISFQMGVKGEIHQIVLRFQALTNALLNIFCEFAFWSHLSHSVVQRSLEDQIFDEAYLFPETEKWACSLAPCVSEKKLLKWKNWTPVQTTSTADRKAFLGSVFLQTARASTLLCFFASNNERRRLGCEVRVHTSLSWAFIKCRGESSCSNIPSITARNWQIWPVCRR